MELKSLMYVSRARPDLTTDDVRAIHRLARTLNALDGVTGLLLFNGVNFMQVVEGAEDAIDDLMRRLIADQRHSQINIVDERLIEQRSFPEWAMKLARISGDYPEAKQDLAVALPDRLSENVRQQIMAMTQCIPDRDAAD